MSKAPGRCIFCGGLGVTKQHAWPDWLKSVIPREGAFHQQLSTTHIHDSEKVLIIPDIRQKRGPLGSRKIRKVCGTCNGGWMSALETSAIPPLKRLIQSGDTVLDVNEQRSVAMWATMTTMVLEFSDPKSVAIPETDRRQFANTRDVPPNWCVWVDSLTSDDWKLHYHHRAAGLRVDEGGIQIEGEIQSSSFGLGFTFIVTASVSRPELAWIADSFAGSHRMVQIWPPTGLPVRISGANPVTTEMANRISNQMFANL